MAQISVQFIVWLFFAMAIFSGSQLLNRFNIFIQYHTGSKKMFQKLISDYIVQGIIHSGLMVLCIWALFSLYFG